MTHPVQTTSLFNKGRLYSTRYYSGNLYQVVVRSALGTLRSSKNTEDGESYEYEVEADTFLLRQASQGPSAHRPPSRLSNRLAASLVEELRQ